MRVPRLGTIFLLLVICSPGFTQDQEIPIGVSAAFKGASKFLGIELYRGSEAYFAEINEKGGVHGRKIKVLALDDGYNPGPAITNTIRFVEHDKCFLLFDYVGTPTVTRVLPLLKIYRDRKMFLFFPFTGAEPQREKPYSDVVYNLRASYRQETTGIVDHLVKIGRKKIAVFYQADAYGRSGWEGVRMALAQYNLEIVGEATYRRGSAFSDSLKPQVDVLKKAQPDAIIAIGTYGPCAAFIRDARQSGWDVPIANVSFVGSAFLLDLLVEAGGKAHKDYTTNLINTEVLPSFEDISLPAVKEYRELMDHYKPLPPEGFGDETPSKFSYNYVSFEGFLNAKLLVEVLKRAGDPPERAKIPSAVESIHDFDLGIKTPITFGPDKNQGMDKVYFNTVVNDRLVPIADWQRWQK
jgi:ABC-type branched-subunit amino acid transport system substrate-binding protein